MSDVSEAFKQVDIQVNIAANDIFGGGQPDGMTLFAITSTGDTDEVVIPLASGGSVDELVTEPQVIRILSHFSRFGIYAPGKARLIQNGGSAEEFEMSHKKLKSYTSYDTTTLICWWDGQIYAATRILRPEGSGDEACPEGIRFGVPEYSVGGKGRVVDALVAAVITSKMLRSIAARDESENDD
jgi:hypothetical protein